jgi:hypothetical protein
MNSQKENQPYDPNALMAWEQMRALHGQAVHQASEILASSPEGVIDGLTITRKAWWRNKGKGTLLMVGLIMTPILVLGFLFSAFTAYFFRGQVAADAPYSNRAGNAVGRVARTTWDISKPAIAEAYVQSVQGQQSPEPPVTVGNERLVLTGASSGNNSTSYSTSGFQGLDSQTRKAVEEFLK